MQWIASCCSTKTLWWWFVIKMEGAWLFANAQILAWIHGMFEFACVTIPGQFIKKAVLIKADNRVWWLCSEIRRVLLGMLFSGKETKRIFICIYFANLHIEYNYFFFPLYLQRPQMISRYWYFATCWTSSMFLLPQTYFKQLLQANLGA